MKNVKQRDLAILANYRREISLQTRIVKNRARHTRKIKHKARNCID